MWTHSRFPAWAPGRLGRCSCRSCWSPSCCKNTAWLVCVVSFRLAAAAGGAWLCLCGCTLTDGHVAQPITTHLTSAHWPMSCWGSTTSLRYFEKIPWNCCTRKWQKVLTVKMDGNVISRERNWRSNDYCDFYLVLNSYCFLDWFHFLCA